jgi:5-methyltetrahydrofolate--homocysteine methyltransferase
MTDLATLTDAIVRGDRDVATATTRVAIDEGLDARSILDAMTSAMEEVGRGYQAGEVYVPEMLLAARAMKESMALLEPRLEDAGVRPEVVAVLGTVRGDLHDIGKNLVGMMWRGANIEVVDLGTNVPPERFVEAAREHGAAVVGISALLTTTMGGMADVVQALREAGLEEVRVIVGGAPLDEPFAARIGADGYAPDAAAAVGLVRQLTRG